MLHRPLGSCHDRRHACRRNCVGRLAAAPLVFLAGGVGLRHHVRRHPWSQPLVSQLGSNVSERHAVDRNRSFDGVRGRPSVAPSVASARRAVIAGIIPRTLILMPTLSIITSTAGWFLAERMGFLNGRLSGILVGSCCTRDRCDAHCAGYRHPTADQRSPLFRNIESRTRHRQDWALDANLCARVAMQGAMQVAIIVIMARFATGL